MLPVSSVQPEAPDHLLEALQGAFIVDEHRAHMGTVVEKVWSVKNGLAEACASLLVGFEVCNVIFLIALHMKRCLCIASSPWESNRPFC